MDKITFLYKIYSQQCKKGDYIILSAKRGKTWKDIPIRYGLDFKKQLSGFFKTYPPNEYDLYWSPMPYSSPARKLVNAQDTKFLVQDIDEVDNPRKIKPKPSYIWESSPNKYQGLWELDRYIKETEYTPLNKDLAKYIGCDDCFDFCHVYRIPGTTNHKYKNKPTVSLPQVTNQIYKPKTIRALIGSHIGSDKPNSSKGKESKSTDLIERKIYAKYNISQKIRELLALDNIEGLDRSGTIWMIENTLHDLGMQPNEIIHLVKNSAFNKYSGRADEDKRLRAELSKIINGEIQEHIKDSDDSSLKVTSYSQVMSNSTTFEGWLVKGFWGKRSHGIVAGMPKCFKSTIVHDLVVSVASGTDFLGKYPVLDPGPVIMVQNENADYVMKDRTEKLIVSRDLCGKCKVIDEDNLKIKFPPDLPIHFINQEGFLMNNEDHRKQLEKMIEEIKPVLVVFDPLYLMFDGDLNSGKDLNPTLNWLLHLKNHYNTSVMVIHHYNKGGSNAPTRGGARMMGSILLYGWIESAWYLSKEDNTDTEDSTIDQQSQKDSVITMAREFRMAGSYPDINILYNMGEVGDPRYEVDVTLAGQVQIEKSQVSLEDEIINILNMNKGPVTRRALADNLGVNRTTLRNTLDAMLEDKKIVIKGEGFMVYKKSRK